MAKKNTNGLAKYAKWVMTKLWKQEVDARALAKMLDRISRLKGAEAVINTPNALGRDKVAAHYILANERGGEAWTILQMWKEVCNENNNRKADETRCLYNTGSRQAT